MMNYWKQSTHVMSYFNTENFRGADRLPDNFMKGFLEVSSRGAIYNSIKSKATYVSTNVAIGPQLKQVIGYHSLYCMYITSSRSKTASLETWSTQYSETPSYASSSCRDTVCISAACTL